MADAQIMGIVGGGTMGAEIAFVAATHGFAVLLADTDLQRAQAGRDRALAIAARRVEHGRMTPDEAARVAAGITAVGGIEDLAWVDAAIEAVPEDLSLKIAVHASIDAVVQPHVLVGTNTSGLSVTTLGGATAHPGRLVGLHFFNPASTMRLVEVIAGTATDGAVTDAACDLASALGKQPVRVAECPGFVVNRVLVRAMAEAYRAAAGVPVNRAAADDAVVRGGPAPMGPFALGDLVGLDVLESIRVDLVRAYGTRFDDAGTVAPLVAAGDLGRKTGAGLVPRDAQLTPMGTEPVIAAVYYAAALDEARRVADEGVASLDDINLAMCLGAGWEQGPLTGT